MNFFSSISYWYFSKRSLPYWCVFAIDCFIVFASSLFVFTLNEGITNTFVSFGKVCATMALYTVCFAISFRLFHTYSGIIRYSSFVDLQRVLSACVVGLFISVALRFLLSLSNSFAEVRLGDMIVWSFLAMGLMWGLRVFVKYMHDVFYSQRNSKRAFIYGIRQGGIAIAKSMRNQDQARYHLAGFLTDDKSFTERYMLGVKVYALDDNIVEEMKRLNVKALFVSPLRSDSLRANQDIVTSLVEAGIKIYMVPKEQEWDGKSDIKTQQMREVDIEDLLPRDKIEVDMVTIGKQLSGKRILITGAAGSIGSEIVRQVSTFNPACLILIDQAETPLHDIRLMMAREFPNIEAHTIVADIANKMRMTEIFNTFEPEYVFHAAAYKHVPMMENNPRESIQNNVEGTRIIADLAVKNGASKFVMVSTDKAVNPTNVMGCSKRICEIYVQSLDKAIKEGRVKGKTQFVTTRFGNVLGSNGSVIPLFKEQIKRGGPLTVTHPDIIRYFMLIPEACKLVLEAGTMGHGGEIFVFDMGEPVKIADLARRMIKLSGVNVDIIFTGLRDGEKLYEEVLNEKETTLPTVHPKIMVAKVREYNYEDVNKTFDELLKISNEGSDMDIVLKMKLIVPEFKSKNSIYEAIDRKLAQKAKS